MRNLIYTFAICLSFSSVSGQDCDQFLLLQNNKKIEITSYNKKTAPVGKQVYSVQNVSNSGDGLSADIQTEMFDKKGKSVSTGSASVKCSGGKMLMSMNMNIPQAQQQFGETNAKVHEFYLEYPATMKEGDKLMDGMMNLDIENNNMQQNITMEITDRIVLGKEKVTTPAGTWDCFKISSKTLVQMKTLGIGIPMRFESIEYFAPGFGIVKTESKQGSTMITAIN